ncbi:MAG TPA: glycosyltransferase [Pilimelia sp.]|nr:glycosyltransferase [Pilimelia sp.]
MTAVTVVVPTVGRPSLRHLLDDLRTGQPGDTEVIVVDDRPVPDEPLDLPAGVLPLTAAGRGPAAARNVGWQGAAGAWVVFLDDDVRLAPGWWDALRRDLDAPAGVGGVQGRVTVPLPPGGPRTDWERVTAALADAQWITADMAYRRVVLAAVGGFDVRFPRAYREDAELAHRVRAAGWSLARGTRAVRHPVRPESPWVSLRSQRGNADDALLRRLYGPRWRATLDIPPGRRRRHAAVTAAGLLAAAAAAARAPRAVTVGAALAWLAGTAEFTAARLAGGRADAREVLRMAATSALIPPLAVAHWLVGWVRHAGARPLTASAGPATASLTAPPAADAAPVPTGSGTGA